MLTVRTTGFKEIEDNLFRMKSSTAKSNVRAAMKEAFEPMARAARAKAPVLTGGLQESVEVTSHGRPPSPGKSPVEMLMGPKGGAKSIVSEFGSFKDTAQPFMRPAWDGGQLRMLDEFGVLLFNRVEKSLARSAAKAAREG